ncbi:MAG: DUF1351 domain-containing protein [Oscillospiraceae bacterium]
MEIQIFNPTQAQPLPEISWNYAELKQQLEAGLANYKGLAYSDDQIGEAKKDRAKLNKLADAIDGKRKEMKALYLRPYEAFEAQAKELVGMVKATVREIDDQVKAYEAARKEEKLRAIQEQYRAMIGDLAELAPYERLHNPRWLNATAGMGAICQELGNKIDRITAGLTAIDGLQLPPELAGPVKAIFLRDFDLAAALAEKDRLQRQQEELARYEAVRAAQANQMPPAAPAAPTAPIATQSAPRPEESPTAEEIFTVDFRIRATRVQLQGLKQSMINLGIKPERI